MEAQLAALAAALPASVDVERLVAAEPMLLRADITAVLAELRRLLPGRDPVDLLLADPSGVLDMQAGAGVQTHALGCLACLPGCLGRPAAAGCATRTAALRARRGCAAGATLSPCRVQAAAACDAAPCRRWCRSPASVLWRGGVWAGLCTASAQGPTLRHPPHARAHPFCWGRPFHPCRPLA